MVLWPGLVSASVSKAPKDENASVRLAPCIAFTLHLRKGPFISNRKSKSTHLMAKEAAAIARYRGNASSSPDSLAKEDTLR